MQKYLFLILLVFVFWPLAAQAGFEFSARQVSTAPPSLGISDDVLMDEPLPIISADSVSAVPLETTGAGDEVYIRRNVLTPLMPSNKEPVDSKGLLNAVEGGHSITMEPESKNAILKKATSSGSQGLVINPYPLKDSATHAKKGFDGAMEQAMMEQTGLLRPVLTPGKNLASGMKDRARKMPAARAFSTLVDTTNPAIEKTLVAEPLDHTMQAPPLAVNQTPPPLSEEVQKQGAAAFQDAVGFGKELPLALALSQIVPPEYSYAFGQSVNTGEIVSWEGGKPWNTVLDDMIAPKGLKAVIMGNQVLIQPIKS